jgi:hypothetical protein
MNCNYFLGFSTLYLEIQLLVIWNNHEYNVLMNYKGMCVYNQGKIYEFVHIVTCKYVVPISVE